MAEPTGRTLLRGGIVISADPHHPEEFVGDVLLNGALIEDIAPHIDVDETSARIIECQGKIVMPGMVDTHRHTWQAPLRFAGADWTIAAYGAAMWRNFGPHYTADDTYTALQLGIAEALDAGITQLLDWNHGLSTPEHADASVQAHLDSGARMILGYGQSAAVWNEMSQTDDHKSYSPPSEDLRRLKRQYYDGGSDLVSLAMAARGPEIGNLDVLHQEWRQADDLDLRISVHVGNGTWSAVRPIDLLRTEGLLHDRITYIHCNSIDDEQLRLIADSGGSASCSVEEELHMGHGHPAVNRLLRVGVHPTLSVDTCSNVAGSLFPIMRAALATVRGERNQALLDADIDPIAVDVTAHDAIMWGTLRGAEANGLGSTTGSLTPGKQADVVVINTDSPSFFPVNYAAGTVVMNGHPLAVETVFVGGRLVKESGKLVGIDLAALRRRSEDLRDRLYAAGGATLGRWSPDLSHRRVSAANVAGAERQGRA